MGWCRWPVPGLGAWWWVCPFRAVPFVEVGVVVGLVAVLRTGYAA